jgi:predicted amidohydrolase YtcJ
VPKSISADLIIVNGNVITVDSDFSIAQAVAVKDGTIIAVGTNDDIRVLADRRTKTLDLKGKTMLPGINDAHIHAGLYWGSRPPIVLDVGYPAVKSIRDIINAVGKKTQGTSPGEWIRGTGLNLNVLKECNEIPARYPTRWDLDLVSPANPVCLNVIPFTIGEQVTWVNTKALELVGISSDTPVPPGCEIVKDRTTGEPTGLLKGSQLGERVTAAVPSLTRKQKKVALLTAMQELNSLGITSITEGALGPGGTGFQNGLWDSEYIEVYRELENEGKLTVRTGIMVLFTSYGTFNPGTLYDGLSHYEINHDLPDPWLRMAGIKLFADGIPLSKTAWMYDDYMNGGNGRMVFPGETSEERCNELMKIVAYCHKLGFRIGIHVTGDRAIDACIDSFIKAEKEEPKGLRHYIIHGDFVTTGGAERMAEYNIGISVQPALTGIVMNILPHFVGQERAARYGCLRTLLDAGVHVAGGSDAPVTYPDWKSAICSIVSRVYRPEGESHRHVTVADAIRMYTMGGAWQDNMENIKGSIEKGKLADFCILDEDILSIEPERIKDIRILMTIVGGKIVYYAGLRNRPMQGKP